MIATVTLTFNRLESLKGCINSIRAAHVEQIIVVDNHTTDGTAEWLANQSDIFTVRLPENRGVIARNFGFNICHHAIRYVAQIDDDVVMLPNWADTMVQAIQQDPSVIATGQCGGYVGDFSGLVPRPDLPVGTYVDTLTGFVWMLDRRRIEAGNSWACVQYDEAFGFRWHEESDLQCTLRTRTGMKLITCPRVADHHSQAGPVDWVLHNANLARLAHKWNGVIQSEEPR